VPLETYESAEFFDQLQRIKNNAIAQPIAVTTAFFGLMGSLVGVISMLIVVVTIAPILVPFMILAGLPTMFVGRRISKIEFSFLVRATPFYRAREYLRRVLSDRDEAKEIRVFGAEPVLRARHTQRRREVEDLLEVHTRRRMRYAMVTVFLSGLALAAALIVVVWMVTTDRIALSAAGAAILAVRFLATSLDQLFRAIAGLFESSTYLADLDAFTSIPVEPPHPLSEPMPTAGTIEVTNVGFTYPGTTTEVLTDISMSIAPGEVVALVGENGSGKTTLAKLISGLYAPTEGTITWGGRKYSDMTRPEIHRNVAVIFQDFVKYQLTALDNIGLGDPSSADDEEAAREAARSANAWSYLEPLPHGLQTILSREYEGGVDLSIGQWQRVALARALRKPAALIVLDEPSASLDPRVEAELFRDIRRILQGRSALLISHRFSTVRLADRILVLRAGRLIETGTHASLMDSGGLYAELFGLQADAYQ
jgi:ATP-binding cassette subfamily B protein